MLPRQTMNGMTAFTAASVLGMVVVVAAAYGMRGRLYATFAAVLLGIQTAVSIPMARHFGPVFPAYVYVQATVYLHYLLLARPSMRPGWYRALISVPASWFAAATFMAFPWAIASGLGFTPHGFWIPYVAALVGLLESMFAREEVVTVNLDGAAVDGLRRHARAGSASTAPGASVSEGMSAGVSAGMSAGVSAGAASGRALRPLRMVQITDPHLGPFMSEARLQRICARAVAREPDLILLTGDFLTMESQSDPEILARALAPLRALEGRVFACLGNHDHEALELVRHGLSSAGVKLLVDAATTVETPAGRVQIVGFDFHFRERAARMRAVCERFPREQGALRLVLLHDPGAFKHLPPGEGDLVLSGHTHGGQLGLLRFGLPHTIVSAMTEIPDHGLWARGRDRLYVHRGTGHYGFPLRLGVPSEQSELHVHY